MRAQHTVFMGRQYIRGWPGGYTTRFGAGAGIQSGLRAAKHGGSSRWVGQVQGPG